MEDVESIANQVLLLKDGELLGIKTTKELLGEIQGKVGQKVIPPDKLPLYKKKYRVSNVLHEDGLCKIRYISKHVKEEEQVTPKLEEVYLYWFT